MRAMTRAFVATCGFLVGSAAFGISFPMVSVEDGQIATNVAPGSRVQFTGEDAVALMRLFPKVTMAGNPPVSEHIRGVLIRSENYDIILSCRDYKWTDDGQLATEAPTCSFTFGRKNGDIYGDPMSAGSDEAEL